MMNGPPYLLIVAPALFRRAPLRQDCCWFLTRSSRVTSLMAVGASLMAARPPRLAAVHPVDPGCLSGRGGGAVASCASTSDGLSAADRVKPNASAGQGSFAGPAANGFASRRIRAPGRDHLLRQRCDGRTKSSKTPALSDLLPPTRDKAHPAFLPAHALPEQIAESVRHPSGAAEFRMDRIPLFRMGTTW